MLTPPPWTPIPKEIQREILRSTRTPYPEAIAYLSVSLDCDERKPVSVAGYAVLWGWSQGKIRRFLARIGAGIQYPESTERRQNQRGEIVLQMPERSGTIGGEIILLSFSTLRAGAERSGTIGGEIAERSCTATIDTDTETESIPFSEIVSHLNTRAGKSFRTGSQSTHRCITARWREGFRLPDFHQVIDAKVTAWANDPKMSEYLRPETLFGPKFEGYLNAAEKPAAEPELTAAEIHHRQAATETARKYGLPA